MYWCFVYKSLVHGDWSHSFALCSNTGLFFLLQPMTLGFLFGKALSFCLGGGPFLFLGDALIKAGLIERYIDEPKSYFQWCDDYAKKRPSYRTYLRFSRGSSDLLVVLSLQI